MKTMMKWFVGISCAVAFIAIAFTPSVAQAQYACRPVSRVGAQSIEGPLTLTCTSCVGGNALVIPLGSYLSFGEDGARLFRTSANVIKTTGMFESVSTLIADLDLKARGSILNDGSTNGGSIAFNDPTRWLSTTTALLESSTAATAGTDTAFTLKALNALDDADRLMIVKTSTGSERFWIGQGTGQTSGFGTGLVANGLYSDSVAAYNATSITVRGQVANGGTAIGVKIGNSNALSTAGAKILSLYSDAFTTERAYFDYLGSLTISGTASSTNAITVPAGARIAFGTSSYLYNSVGGTVSSSGGIFANGVIESNSGVKVGPSSATCEAATRGIQRYVEGAAGVADKVEVCMKSAADTYAWATMFTAP